MVSRSVRLLSWIALWVTATAAAQPAASRPVLRPPDLPADPTVWPNRQSWRNSDPWLVANHDRIRKMRPRVLVLNFANDVDMAAIRKHAEGFIRATAQATRYHGYRAPGAPAFIEYQVVRYVDLRDTSGPLAGKHVISSRFPRKKEIRTDRWGNPEVLCDYARFYSDEFARCYGFADPRNPGRYLNLHELINGGYVHELWFYAIHDPGDHWPGCETVELKQFYDEQLRPIPGKYGHAGNGRDRTMPWSGRSFRIAFFNPHRGVGCAMENYGHTLEWIANSGSIPYYRRYFYEYAELDLDRRYGVPFDELYRTDPADKNAVSYPSPTCMVVQVRGKSHRIEPYVAFGGNVHFPPGARHHYDLSSPYTVKSVIENYRMRNGPDGRDLVTDFNIRLIAAVGDVAPDCMGNWVVFWRQCMPGLDNRCVDDDGRPMKNWWVFMFY